MASVENKTVRVVLADDHAIVRAGLREYLEAKGAATVVGQCSSGVEVIDLLRTVKADVLVLDLQMPGRSGLETIAQRQSRWQNQDAQIRPTRLPLCNRVGRIWAS